jgi:hypothetical protein
MALRFTEVYTYFVTEFGFGEQWREDASRLSQYAFFNHASVLVLFEFQEGFRLSFR